MAGTLTISTLSDGTNSTSSTNCIKGSAKAWLNYNATTQTVNGSYNVSSVVYNGTGNYTVNLTSAVSDTNYSVAMSAQNNGGVLLVAGFTANSASQIGIYFAQLNGAGNSNPLVASFALFR